MNTNFHNKNFALSLASIMRLKATWKWPILMPGQNMVVTCPDFSLTTNQFSRSTEVIFSANKASEEATKINSFVNVFWNNITFANEEKLFRTWWLAKNKIPLLFTDFEVEFSISLTVIQKSLKFPQLWKGSAFPSLFSDCGKSVREPCPQSGAATV